MTMLLKIIAGLIALLFLFMGVGFVLDPSGSASSVGFSAPGEHGLNTLRGDLGGLFLASTALIGLGLYLRKGEWLVAVAILMLFIAAGRLIGFIVDGNPAQTALVAFGFEILIAGVMFATSRRLGTIA